MKRSRSTWWRVLAALAAMGLLAAACGDDDGGGTEDTSGGEIGPGGDDPGEEADAPRPQYGGTVTVGLEAETNTWTPGPIQAAAPGLAVTSAVYDPLVALNADGEFEPFLAADLQPNDDLSEWTLTLRPDVVFHDGTPLDAAAIVWNFEELHFGDDDQTQGTLIQAGVEGIEEVDPMTVVYRLNGPNAAFPDLLRGEAGWPVSPTAYQADPENFGDKPVGTGPFVFQSWAREDRIVLTRNEDYWREDADGNQLPYLDEVIFRPIPDEDARVASLAAGDLQVMHTLRGSNVKQVLQLVDDGGFRASQYVGNESGSAILNVLEPPLDDLRVRTALALAGDSYAVQEVLGDDGLTEPSTGFFSVDSPWYSEVAAAAYPAAEGRDIEEASRLIEEYRNDPERSDGQPPGSDVTVTYNCPPDPSLIAVSQLQQSLWGDAGVTVELGQVEQAQHITNAVGNADTEPPFRGNFVINCWRAGGGTGDPLTALQSFFGEVTTTPGNFTNYTNPEIDEQLDILRTNADFATRYAAVERIGVISAEEVPILWSSPTPTVVGYVANLHGLEEWTLPSGSLGTGTSSAIPRLFEAFFAE